MNIPKIIWIYSAQHTGTWFVHSILTACNISIYTRHDRGWEQKRFPANTDEFYLKYLAGTTDGVLSTIRFPFSTVIIQSHHEKLYAPVWNSLTKENNTGSYVIVPVRDPILSLNTCLWRNYRRLEMLQKVGPNTRGQMAARHLQLYNDLLSLPDSSVFFFPIDSSYLETKSTRVTQALKLYKYCDIMVTTQDYYAIENIADNWQPINATKGDSTHWQAKHFGPAEDIIFNEVKQQLKHGNLELFKQYFDIEYEELMKMEELLRPKLERLGYDNLAWWT